MREIRGLALGTYYAKGAAAANVSARVSGRSPLRFV
jgi:hypothetical protein